MDRPHGLREEGDHHVIRIDTGRGEGIKPVAKGFALALALFQIWFTTGFGVLDGSMMRVMFVSFITVLVFLFIPCRKYKENEKEPTLFLLIDLCCAGLAIATAVYFALHLTEITTRMRYIDDVTPAAKFFAAATGPARPRNHPPHHGWALVIVASTLILVRLLRRHAAPRRQAYGLHLRRHRRTSFPAQ